MRIFTRTILLLILALTLTFCTGKKKNDSVALSEQTHGKYAKPNYSIVFPNDKVNRIDIKIDAEQWAKMQADLKSNIGGNPHRMPPPDKTQGGISESQRERRPMGGPPKGGQNMENDSNHPHNPAGRMGPPPGGRQGGKEYEPIWQYCDIYFNKQKWNEVGIRFKGNSSLRTTYQQGIKKLSFKLDFDEFEDKFPEIKNQRFYGFKQLNLKNNFLDDSFVREKLASDLFSEVGIVSPQTAFYRVYVDFGEGEKYFGLYTMVEEVDDTVIETQFESEDENLYKPEGRASTFAANTFNAAEMNKKDKNKDYNDVQQLNTIINSSLRIENYERWKSQLTTIFDVPVFIKWLAANTVIQNWDTYGEMPHNYYLYHNSVNDKLEWIPWDNNEAFQESKRGKSLSLSLNEVNESWPLIRYVLDDEQWELEYKKYLEDFTSDVFNSEKTQQRISSYQQLILSAVVGDTGEQAPYSFLQNEQGFFEAMEVLKGHCVGRQIAVDKYIKQMNTE